MHPSLVRSFVDEGVAELRARLEKTPGVDVAEVALEPGPLLLAHFDHEEYETEVIAATSALVGPGGQPFSQQQRVPILGRPSRHRRLALRMELDRFDLLPPTAELLEEDGEPLPADKWPTSFAGGGIVERHPIYDRPFFCRPGLREYHSHPQHEDEPWAKWRPLLPLHTIVTRLLKDLRVRWHGAA